MYSVLAQRQRRPGLLAMEQFEELEEERRKNKNPAAVPKGTANPGNVHLSDFKYFFPAADTGQRDCIPQPVWQRASNGPLSDRHWQRRQQAR